MLLVDILCCILIVIIAVVLAILVVRALVEKPPGIALGGYDSLSLDDTVYSCYKALDDYIAELTFEDGGSLINPVGNIERYLSALYDVKSLSVPEDIKNDSSIKHKKLYTLVQKIVREYNFSDKNDFIYNSGVCYLRFVPEGIANAVRDSYKHDIFDKREAKHILENAISPTTIYGDEMDHWLSRLRVLSRLYHKYKKGSLKKSLKGAKTVSALVKVLPTTEASFEMDEGAFRALIYQFSKEIRLRQELERIRKEGIPEGENMAKRLARVDLLTAWRQDPYLVRRFINRIRQEIKEIEARRDFYDAIDPLSKSLYDDLIEEERKEREFRRAHEKQIQRDLERERLEKERLRKRFAEEGLAMREPTPAPRRIPTPGDKSGLVGKKPYEVAEIPPFRGQRTPEFPPKGDRRLASAPFG